MEALSAQIGYKCSWNLLKLFWIPAGELIHSGQGCNAFTQGCSMGGLDPNKFMCSVSSRLERIHKKKKSLTLCTRGRFKCTFVTYYTLQLKEGINKGEPRCVRTCNECSWIQFKHVQHHQDWTFPMKQQAVCV